MTILVGTTISTVMNDAAISQCAFYFLANM